MSARFRSLKVSLMITSFNDDQSLENEKDVKSWKISLESCFTVEIAETSVVYLRRAVYRQKEHELDLNESRRKKNL